MTDQPADWKTMEAGEPLDILVHQKIGWTLASDVIASRNLSRALITGEGNEYPLVHFTGVDPWHTAWTDGLLYHFSTDLNAAFTLFSTELGLEWNLFSDFQGITCELGHWNNEPGQADQLEQWNDKTAPLAIVKAWLLWQERKDHPKPEYPKEGIIMGNYELFYPGTIERLRKEVARLEKENADLRLQLQQAREHQFNVPVPVVLTSKPDNPTGLPAFWFNEHCGPYKADDTFSERACHWAHGPFSSWDEANAEWKAYLKRQGENGKS